jgi:hypothetical protein
VFAPATMVNVVSSVNDPVIVPDALTNVTLPAERV